jgi:hypothetical protein
LDYNSAVIKLQETLLDPINFPTILYGFISEGESFYGNTFLEDVETAFFNVENGIVVQR